MATPVTLMQPDPVTGAEKIVGTAASPFQMQAVTAGTGTTTRVATSTTVAPLRAANAARKGLTIYNESTAILYVKLGSGATSTDYTYALPASGYYEIPYGYTGIVTGVLASGTGNAQVTEFT